MLDLDEINHIDRSFFILNGQVQHKDFYSIYPPFFQYLILPIIIVTGKTFNTILVLRLCMIGLFAIRTFAFSYIARKIFGYRAMMFSLLFLLFDPFTQFSSVQVRPDNVMITLLLIAIALFASGIMKKRIVFLGGLLLSMSLIFHLKLFPTICIFLIAWLLYLIHQKRIYLVLLFIVGCLFPFVILVLYGAMTNSLSDLIQQSVFDPMITFGFLMYPVFMGDLMKPNNFNLYGENGKPFVWMFTWLLPMVGFAGAYSAMFTNSQIDERSRTKFSIQTYIITGLSLGLVLQLLLLFRLNSVFIQYYQVITWMYAIFAGHVVSTIFASFQKYTIIRFLLPAIEVGIILIMSIFGIHANMNRAVWSWKKVRLEYENIWSKVPEDKTVYPRFLFRTSSHPLSTAQFYPELPEKIKSRYPTIESVLETDKTDVLILSQYELNVMGPAFRAYVSSNYRKDPDEVGLYFRLKDK